MTRLWMMPIFAASTLLVMSVEGTVGSALGIVAESETQSSEDTPPVSAKLPAAPGAITEGLYRDSKGQFARLRFVSVNERLAIQREFLGGPTVETLWTAEDRGLAIVPHSGVSIVVASDGGVVLAAQTDSGGVPAAMVWSGLGLDDSCRPRLVVSPREVRAGVEGSSSAVIACRNEHGLSDPQLMIDGPDIALMYEVKVVVGAADGEPGGMRTAIVTSKLSQMGSEVGVESDDQVAAQLVALGEDARVADGDHGLLVVYNDEMQPGDRYKVRRFLRRGADDQWSAENWTLPGDLKWGSGEHAIYAGNSGYILVAVVPASGPNPRPSAAGQTANFVTLVTCTLVWESADVDVDGVMSKGGVAFTEVSKPILRGSSCRAALCAGIGPEGSVHSYAIFCD